MEPELTPGQQRLFDYMKKTIESTGHTPSLRQAAGDLGITHGAVSQRLKNLEKKGVIKRQGPYSRTIHLLNPVGEKAALQRWREIPVVGRIIAGLPLYAQQEWEGSLVVDDALYRGQNLFALRVQGDSMKGAAILDGDIAICMPRQYAENCEIVVALVHEEEATVKRFFLHRDHVELRPENPDYPVMRYGFDEVLVQGKVVGIQRGAAGIR
ncbi:LexA repressor 1 (plasmid) [Desulfosarcina ovata subsp. sediminis]|uniref:LexA repressor n=1 Tax=Desulfosarcina ovata subsp. sediminis TaxID=885957 RepID=A0A5K8A2F8_9BACT|nr:transcriptional repressor LexA [Desulfosarcina ovata]BBO86722.1 LexA repressor 1 [Desulfosarcina ovata subsp. sediminis]